MHHQNSALLPFVRNFHKRSTHTTQARCSAWQTPNRAFNFKGQTSINRLHYKAKLKELRSWALADGGSKASIILHRFTSEL